MKKSFRGKYNWVQILHSLNNKAIEQTYFRILNKLVPNKKGHCMSANRCAYYALKTWYSTTTIAELVRKLGL